MEVTYYDKNSFGGTALGYMGVSIAEKEVEIRNLVVLPSKTGGWFIVMPSFKNRQTDKWEKVLVYGKEKETKFLDEAREALKRYAAEKRGIIA